MSVSFCLLHPVAMRSFIICSGYKRHKNKHAPYTYTRGNNKILRTPPPHTSSSEEILPRPTRRTLAQPRTNKSPFLKSYLHKVDTKTHPSPLCPLCNIHTSSLQLHPHTHHIVAPGVVDRPRGRDCTAGQISWLVDHKREHRTPPTSKSHGSG